MTHILVTCLSLVANVVLAGILRVYIREELARKKREAAEQSKAAKRRDELIAQNLESGMTSYDAERSADDLLAKESREARAAFLEVHGLPADPPPPPPPTPEEVATRNRLWRDLYSGAQQDYNSRAGLGSLFR